MDLALQIEKAFDSLGGIADEALTLAMNELLDRTPEDMAASDLSAFLSAAHTPMPDPIKHTERGGEKRFDKVKTELVQVFAKSMPIIDWLATLHYPTEEEIKQGALYTEIFTVSKIKDISLDIRTFNNTIASVQLVVDDFKTRGDAPTGSEIIVKALVDGMNTIIDGMMAVIKKHNDFFSERGMSDRLFGNVNKMVY
jgi:hypothetical protein